MQILRLTENNSWLLIYSVLFQIWFLPLQRRINKLYPGHATCAALPSALWWNKTSRKKIIFFKCFIIIYLLKRSTLFPWISFCSMFVLCMNKIHIINIVSLMTSDHVGSHRITSYHHIPTHQVKYSTIRTVGRTENPEGWVLGLLKEKVILLSLQKSEGVGRWPPSPPDSDGPSPNWHRSLSLVTGITEFPWDMAWENLLSLKTH